MPDRPDTSPPRDPLGGRPRPVFLPVYEPGAVATMAAHAIRNGKNPVCEEWLSRSLRNNL